MRITWLSKGSHWKSLTGRGKAPGFSSTDFYQLQKYLPWHCPLIRVFIFHRQCLQFLTVIPKQWPQFHAWASELGTGQRRSYPDPASDEVWLSPRLTRAFVFSLDHNLQSSFQFYHELTYFKYSNWSYISISPQGMSLQCAVFESHAIYIVTYVETVLCTGYCCGVWSQSKFKFCIIILSWPMWAR